jgi:coenzyme F420 hydrogenase subunit beta
MSYEDSWGFLQQYRPFRCYLCPDGTGEFSDISCGDPWYREVREGEAGSSLVLVRTERGRKILQGAMAEGYVQLTRVPHGLLEASQRNLLRRRRSVWGRILAMKVMLVPFPEMKGFHLFSNWLDGDLGTKARSVLGTARRIFLRGYRKPYRYGDISP